MLSLRGRVFVIDTVQVLAMPGSDGELAVVAPYWFIVAQHLYWVQLVRPSWRHLRTFRPLMF